MKKTEQELYEKNGILIVISNNQKKSLAKSQIILNLDFNKEVLNRYKINETAKIDKLEITLTNFKYLDNDIVEFTFKITNNRDNSITLNPDNNFKIYNSTNAQIPNIYSNDSNIIKSKDTMNYTLQYNIKNRELYEILFYSGIVENNIKFTVTNNDIK